MVFLLSFFHIYNRINYYTKYLHKSPYNCHQDILLKYLHGFCDCQARSVFPQLLSPSFSAAQEKILESLTTLHVAFYNKKQTEITT